MENLFSRINISGVEIGNIHRLPGPIQRGQLSGNQFDIIIRDVNIHSSDVDGGSTMATVEEEIARAVDNVQVSTRFNILTGTFIESYIVMSVNTQ